MGAKLAVSIIALEGAGPVKHCTSIVPSFMAVVCSVYEVVTEFLDQVFKADLTVYHAAGSYYTAANEYYQRLYVNNPESMIPFHPAAQAYLENLGVGDLSSDLG